MAIWNLGSINIDHVYRLPHLPAGGETLAADSYATGLGGKGANQSVAAARAGAVVRHIGAVGGEGGWAVDRMVAAGVDVTHVARVDTPTGHAIINVDAAAENTIVIFPGANRALPLAQVQAAIAAAAPGDTLILQNETAWQVDAAQMARARGLSVLYSAAPFDADATRAVLPHVTLLALNAVEAAQLTDALGVPLDRIPVPHLLVTRGADGADWHDLATGTRLHQPAFPVTPVDTTGAGDTFAGYLAAGLDSGLTPEQALRRAAAASAIKVTRPGAGDAVPTASEVDTFLKGQP